MLGFFLSFPLLRDLLGHSLLCFNYLPQTNLFIVSKQMKIINNDTKRIRYKKQQFILVNKNKNVSSYLIVILLLCFVILSGNILVSLWSSINLLFSVLKSNLLEKSYLRPGTEEQYQGENSNLNG